MRYKPNIQWSKNNWTYNMFRFYEIIFGRKYGIRHESSAGTYIQDGKKIEYVELYSFEAKMVFCEVIIRKYFADIKRNISRIKFQPFILQPSFAIVGFNTIAKTKWQPTGYAFSIATDAIGSYSVFGSGTTFGWTHVVTGSNPFLFVGIGIPSSDASAVTVTYNASSLTALDKLQISGDRWGYDFYHATPATGSHTITESSAGTNDAQMGMSSSYSGVLGLDAHTTATGSSVTSLSATVTTVANNCWLVALSIGTAAHAAGTNTVTRVDLTSRSIIDSNSAQTPAGSHSLQVTCGSSNQVILIASMSPVSSGTTTSAFLLKLI